MTQHHTTTIPSDPRPRTSFSSRLLGILAATVLCPLLAGCPGTMEPAGGSGGSGGGGAGGSGPPCDAPTMVFKPTCATGTVCHAAGSPFPPNLSLTDPTAAVVGVKSISVAPCLNMPLVNAADPASSVLLTRIKGSSCGEQMPSQLEGAKPALTADQIACVTSWVMSKRQ